MIITKIQKSQNNYFIYIDENFIFKANQKDLDYLKLNENLNITQSDYNYIIKYVYDKARNSAYKFLGYKARTEKELRIKLGDSYNDYIVNEIVELFKKHNYINDENYAEMYIKNRIESKSIKSIKYELTQKGICRDIIDNIINDLNINDLNTAIKVLEKKFKIITDINQKQKEKIYSYMLRKGFDYETINKILKTIIETK